MIAMKANLLGWAAPAAIAAAVFLVYLPSLPGNFLWDDDQHLVDDPFMADLDGLRRIWLAPEPGGWHYWPLTRSSFWLERRIWGLNPLGYRLVNLSLHVINSLLLWKILAALKIPGGRLAALLFALHPVNVETAAWITQRKNTLSMFFYLLSLHWYLEFERKEKGSIYTLSLAAFVFALLAKTAVVILPPVLLLLALWKGRPRLPAALRRLAPYFLLALAAGLVSVWFERNFFQSAGPAWGLTPARRLILAPRTFWFYLSRAVWPHPVAFVYPRWELDTSAIAAWIFLPALVAIPVLFFLTRRRPIGGVFFALSAYAVSLFPVLGFFNIYYMRYSYVADHWQYHALPAVIALAAALGVAGWRNIRKKTAGSRRFRLDAAAGLLVSAAVGSCAVLTLNYARQYRSPEALWLDTLEKNPAAWMAEGNLGVLFLEQARYAEALERFSRAITIKPDEVDAHLNRGVANYLLGNLPRAREDIGWAIALRPDYPEAHYNLAIVLEALGKAAAALESYNRAIELNPGRPDFHSRRDRLILRLRE